MTPAVLGDGYPRAGARAQLAGIAHNVGGTATIVNSNTLRFTEFNYDGGGIVVYFYLGTNDSSAAFSAGLPIGTNLFGTAFSDDTVTVTLPPGQSLDGYHAVSVWCVTASANFGSGAFQPHVDAIGRTNGITSLRVSGSSPEVYELQTSTNAANWTALTSQTNTSGEVWFQDTNGSPALLYRVQVEQ